MHLAQLAMAGLMLTFTIVDSASGNPYVGMVQQLADQNWRRWQAINTTGGSPVAPAPAMRGRGMGRMRVQATLNQKALEEYLNVLVPAAKPLTDVAHVPKEYAVPLDPQKRWTRYYTQAKLQLRPRIQYQWRSNVTGDTSLVTLTEEHVATLRANFDVVMWYRNELEILAESQQNAGAQHFQLFLDYTIGGMLDGLPQAPDIAMGSGSVSAPSWELDERQLREQLVMAYRYLLAKYQTYPEYEEFKAADVALLTSLMNIGLLMGAQIYPESIDGMSVDLTSNGPNAAWKRPMAELMGILKTRSEQGLTLAHETSDDELRPCIVKIPAPKPKDAPKATTPETQESPPTQRVEIIVHPK